jgi:hypothetical protein
MKLVLMVSNSTLHGGGLKEVFKNQTSPVKLNQTITIEEKKYVIKDLHLSYHSKYSPHYSTLVIVKEV